MEAKHSMEAKNFMEEKQSIEKTQSMEEKELHVVKKHKDTVFRMLYNDRSFSLSLYSIRKTVSLCFFTT